MLKDLFKKEFTWTIIFDENLASWGLELRKEFYGSSKTVEKMVNMYGEFEFPCSILEMMVALSKSCEENVMSNWSTDRTFYWFWSMIESLGLDIYDNFSYDEDEIDEILERFLLRKYEKNGKGGLFTVHKNAKNMQKIDIWLQMNAWLIENFESEM